MSSENLEKLQQSDAPASTAVHQRDVGKEEAAAQEWKTAALVGRTVTVNKPRQELYAFWRDFNNLARFLENIESVQVKDPRVSHWTVKAPAGQTVQWDAAITEEQPDRLIAWESAPDAQIKHAGRVEFLDAPPGRGTWVRVTLAYEPPAGELGKAIAKLFQKEPKMQARRDLRRFKQLMETGEISTSARCRQQAQT
ncbi:MAG: SRPBCC family protein [Caulobacteraceae bacterium]|nr:SRPBCC family protein [Caulobacteraceae bacterium]